MMNSLLAFIAISIFTSTVFSVPILSESPSNRLEDSEDIEVMEDDDFTTRSLERLSSAATCLVAGIEYTHGQQINRIDPCEFCLCLDGEMFCWWQDCPPATDGPCKDQGPFSQCDNIATKTSSSSSSVSPVIAQKTTNSSTVSKNEETEETKSTTSSVGVTSSLSSSSTTSSFLTSSFPVPKVCIVMGIEYRIGEKLPHDTGNCVECICGEGAKIACSPHQCAPLGDDINDYRPPEPQITNLDSF